MLCLALFHSGKVYKAEKRITEIPFGKLECLSRHREVRKELTIHDQKRRLKFIEWFEEYIQIK